jgi:hypothetical protein
MWPPECKDDPETKKAALDKEDAVNVFVSSNKDDDIVLQADHHEIDIMPTNDKDPPFTIVTANDKDIPTVVVENKEFFSQGLVHLLGMCYCGTEHLEGEHADPDLYEQVPGSHNHIAVSGADV